MSSGALVTIEAVGVWTAILAYAAATALYIVGLVFGKEGAGRAATVAVWIGLAGQAAAFTSRWVRIGHGPYLGFYEVASLVAFTGVAAFAFIIWRYPGFKVAGVAIMPVALLILGATTLVSKDAEPITGSLASFWLAVHVAFANLAYGAYAAAFVLASGYLLREYGRGRRWQDLLDKLPAQDVIDDLTFRFVGAGFIFQGVMIASGAVWANEAWGRYWGWDPMETWSLIAWAVYAAYLHLRLTMGWKGRRAAWVAVTALPIIVFSLLGVPVVYKSIHGAYLQL